MESDEDVFFGQEVYDSMVLAWRSLWDMYFEDLNFGNGFLLRDADFGILSSHGLLEGLLILASPQLGYSSRDYYQIFTSVGYNVPVKVAAMREIREEYWKE
ncbi:MAG: hypothetical protein IKF90_12030 [Parasporobacterium sp.]|nr:hypothetical protein [Parasporobacterium sp.]